MDKHITVHADLKENLQKLSVSQKKKANKEMVGNGSGEKKVIVQWN